MNVVRLSLLIVLMCAQPIVIAQSEIYRCFLADGSFVITDNYCADGERRIDGVWVNIQEEILRNRKMEELIEQRQMEERNQRELKNRNKSNSQETRPRKSHSGSRSSSSMSDIEKKVYSLFLRIASECGNLSGAAEQRCFYAVRSRLSDEDKIIFDYLDK